MAANTIKNNNVKIVPADEEAEIAVLGCCFLEPSLVAPKILDELLVEDFYNQKNSIIFMAISELYKDGIAIDSTTVIGELDKRNVLKQAGGYEYITSIYEHSYTVENVDVYISRIQDSSLRRKTIDKLRDLSEVGFDREIDTFDYVENVERTIFELSNARKGGSLVGVSDVIKSVSDSIAKRSQQSATLIGLDTGIAMLNKVTQGFQPGQLIILAARPAMGKSAFALNLAQNVARFNKKGHASVAVFSLEMSAEQLVERMIACDSSISLGKLKTGQFDTQEATRFATSSTKISKLNIFFDDTSNISVASIRAKCRTLKSNNNLDMIVIDYLQLIESDQASAKLSTSERVTKITRGLKLMARELNVPVIALSQLSREVEKRDDKKPIMADLRDSGSIEQDADIVMFLYREDYYLKSNSTRQGEADLIIAKNRSGSTNEGIPFTFIGELQKFIEKAED
jgi:replicative DNA helicase